MINRRLPLWILIALLFFYVLSNCSKPQVSGFDSEEIDTSRNPIQRSITSHDPIVIEKKEGHYTLTPVAEYELAGKVVSKETYSYGWESDISPLDLAIAWGKLAEPEYEKSVYFSQGNRWYFYEYKPDSPLDNDYILSHSSNSHIIPASLNLFYAIKAIGKNEKVILEGFLVNLKGTYKGGTVYWNTSFTRKDTGNGSCELFYVTKVRINNDVYE